MSAPNDFGSWYDATRSLLCAFDIIERQLRHRLAN